MPDRLSSSTPLSSSTASSEQSKCYGALNCCQDLRKYVGCYDVWGQTILPQPCENSCFSRESETWQMVQARNVNRSQGGDSRKGPTTQGYTYGNGRNEPTVAPMFHAGGQPYCHGRAMPWMVKAAEPGYQNQRGHRHPYSSTTKPPPKSQSPTVHSSQALSLDSSRSQFPKSATKPSSTATTVTKYQSHLASSRCGIRDKNPSQQQFDAGVPCPIPCGAKVMNACMGMYPQTTQAMEAIHTHLPPEWPPRPLHGGEPCSLDDKGIDFKFKPRPDFATEVTFSIEPKKKPMWQKMMRVGFRPMITCGAPPFVLPSNWQTYHRPDLQHKTHLGSSPPQQLLQPQPVVAEKHEEHETSSEGSAEESSDEGSEFSDYKNNGRSSDEDSSQTSSDASESIDSEYDEDRDRKGIVQDDQKGDSKGNVLRDSKGNVLRDSKGNVLRESKGNIPRDSKGNIPRDSKGNIPRDSKGNIPRDSKGNIPRDSKGNVLQDKKGNSLRDSKGKILKDSKGNVLQDKKGNSLRDSKGKILQDSKGNVQRVSKGNVQRVSKGNVQRVSKGNVVPPKAQKTTEKTQAEIAADKIKKKEDKINKGADEAVDNLWR